jgi:hypothetical protein
VGGELDLQQGGNGGADAVEAVRTVSKIQDSDGERRGGRFLRERGRVAGFDLDDTFRFALEADFVMRGTAGGQAGPISTANRLRRSLPPRGLR